ncbi:MAG: hypothetical protein ABIO71_13410 [Caldimonas sp.]
MQALSRWENEGGATYKPGDSTVADHMPSDDPQLSNAELVQLRIRVIALENLVISLLSQADESERQRVREMAAYISPRPGYTHHPLTLMAACQMISLADRAASYRALPEG